MRVRGGFGGVEFIVKMLLVWRLDWFLWVEGVRSLRAEDF